MSGRDRQLRQLRHTRTTTSSENKASSTSQADEGSCFTRSTDASRSSRSLVVKLDPLGG